MSDHISERYSKNEVFEFVGNTSIGEGKHPYELQWVAHWTRASSSTTLENNEHCAVTNIIKDQIESIKPSNSSVCRSVLGHNSEKQDPTSYTLHSAEARRWASGRVSLLGNSAVKNNVKSFGSEEFKERSAPKLPTNGANLCSYNYQNSGSSNSEWSHFPMFDINRKIETIMDPKKRASFYRMAHLNEIESSLAPHSIEILSEERRYQQDSITRNDEDMIPSETLGDSTHYNCQRPSMRSSNRNNGKNDIFGLAPEFKEQSANANLAYVNHEPRKCSDHRCFPSSLTGSKDGSNAIFGYTHHSDVAQECSRERENLFAKNNTVLGLSKLNKMSNSARVASTCSGSKKERIYISEAPVMKEVSMDSCQEVQEDGNPTVIANVGTAFFERLTLPSVLHCKGRQEEKLLFPVSLMNNIVGAEGIDRHSIEKQDESLVKTDMHIDVCQTPSSPKVGNSLEAQEIPQNVVRPNMESSKTVDTVTDISITKSMDVESYAGKPSNPPARTTQPDSEPSSKWVKRLRSYPLDPFPLGAKRFKMQDALTSGEMQNLLTKVVNYNKSFSNLPEGKQLDETTFLPKNGELSPEDSAKLIPWIRRWCKRNHEKSSHTRPENATHRAVLCEPEHSRLLPQMFEAQQLPSLAAMALVGRQVTNFRPCEFQKRGPTVVWNA